MRKNLKLSLTLVLAVVMLFAVAIIASAGTEPTASGECGKTDSDNVIWEYYADTATLVISGKGKMASCKLVNDQPWKAYRSTATNIVVESGITEIGQYAFAGFKYVTSFTVPDTVTVIRYNAFYNMSGLTKLELGSGVKTIEKSAFARCTALEGVYIKDLKAWCAIDFKTPTANPGAIGKRAIYLNGELLTDLTFPSDITTISKYAFCGVHCMKTLTLDENITSVGALAFGGTRFEYIYINSATVNYANYAFRSMLKSGFKGLYINDPAAWMASTFAQIPSNPMYMGNIKANINGVVLNASTTDEEHLIIPEGATTLNYRALYSRVDLTSVYIPESVTSIAGTTKNTGPFTYCTRLSTIYGVAGSYAETYAADKGYKFVAVTPVAATGITLDTEDTTLAVGDSLTATATIAPAEANTYMTIWSSSDRSVAMVTDGVVKAVGAGTATITAATSDGSFSDTFVVTVPAISVTDVTLDATEITLELGHTTTLVATVAPADASDKTVTWKSSNTKVAKVANGVVTPVAGGTATITVTTADGGFTATCLVTVEVDTIAVTGITLDATVAVLKEGEKLTLTATVTPDDATDKTVTWTSSEESVATVANGVVTALKAGKTTITAKTADGNFTAECAITVEAATVAVTGVTLDTTAASLKEGETLQLTATVTPDDATDKTVTWTSSNETVATVVDGLVTALASGDTTITVKTVDGEFTAECAITVTPSNVPVEEIALDVEELAIVIGESYQFEVTFTPADTTETALVWESTNEDVATITQDGLLEAVGTGVTIITVISEANGDLFAECVVEVLDGIAVESLTLNKTTANVYLGDVVTLTVTYNPTDATNKNVTWESSDDTIVTVVDGVVTAVGDGVATVTVTSEDSGCTATCKFIVTVGNETPPIEWGN